MMNNNCKSNQSRVLNKPLKTLLVVCSLILSACVATHSRHAANPEQPCWLQQPVSSDSIGQIGIARDLYIGGKQPRTLSRIRALNQMANYLQKQTALSDVVDNIDENTKAVELAGTTVYFVDDYRLEGYVYSYVSLSDSLDDSLCRRNTCDLNACEPAWLCQPTNDDGLAVLGVSYRATSPVQQYQKAVENGLLQAEYLYGVNVDATRAIKQLHSKLISHTGLSQSGDVDEGELEPIRHLATDHCFTRGTLFSRVAIFGAGSDKHIVDSGDTAWLENPKYQGFDGAVGSVQLPVASGLMSDQIELAIKRAAIDLAFEQHTDASENSLNVHYQSGNSLMVSYIHQGTSVELQAEVLSIHFRPGNGDFVEVFAWVAAKS